MRLKPEESKKLTQHLANHLFADQTIALKATRPKIQDTIEKVIVGHFEEERQLEVKAEALFSQQDSGNSDNSATRSKALPLIRKQLAKEHNFILSGGMDVRFTEDKIYHLAHLVADRLYDDDLLDFPDEDDGPKFFRQLLMTYFGRENAANAKARAKIASLSNAPFEGSKDWEVLFRKYVEEELKRLG